MKFHGKTPVRGSVKHVFLPRSSEDENGNIVHADLVFLAKTADLSAFSTLYPEPKPPSIMMAGETNSRPDFTDPDYKKELSKYNRALHDYLYIMTYKDTEGLEFERVKLDDPTTWCLFHDELIESGITEAEFVTLASAALEVNSLSDDAVEQARARFFRSPRRQ